MAGVGACPSCLSPLSICFNNLFLLLLVLEWAREWFFKRSPRCLPIRLRNGHVCTHLNCLYSRAFQFKDFLDKSVRNDYSVVIKYKDWEVSVIVSKHVGFSWNGLKCLKYVLFENFVLLIFCGLYQIIISSKASSNFVLPTLISNGFNRSAQQSPRLTMYTSFTGTTCTKSTLHHGFR